MDFDRIVDKTVDKVFSMKRSTIYLLAIFLLGFVLRLIAAINLTVSADDMHHVLHAVNFFSSGRLITYDQSSGLWHGFTSIIYSVFGMTQLTSRVGALVFGSLSILVVYLLTKEFFGERAGLLAAFLLAIAPFHIGLTVAEMDNMAMFFVLFGMLLFVKALKSDKGKYFALSGIFMGLAIYTKVYPLLFIPSLLLFFVYFKRKSKEKVLSKGNIKKLFVFLAIIFIFALPALTHNYLLYKDKGFLDMQFTRTTGLGKDISAQYYSWDVQFEAKNDWKGLIFGNSVHSASSAPLLYTMVYNVFFLGSPISFILGMLGLLLILFSREYRKAYSSYVMLFILSILFVLPFLASIIPLPKHFVFFELLAIPMGGFALSKINGKVSRIAKVGSKIVLLALFVISLIYLGVASTPSQHAFYGKSYMAQAIDFKDSEIPKNSLIVADSRIYRGSIHWLSYGRPYLEGTQFISIINNQDQLAGDVVPIDVYYFECALDDCGWGSVKNQPEFNASMESLTSEFESAGQLEKIISAPVKKVDYYPLISGENKKETIKVYHLSMPMKESVLAFASQPKEWFLYPIGYDPVENNFDYYTARGALDRLLDMTAHFVVLLALILTFFSPLYLIYLLSKK